MKSKHVFFLGIAVGLLSAIALVVLMSQGVFQAQLEAAGGKVTSPTDIAPDRYAYYPGSEPLKPDEIRLIACGTGMPAARRDQAASCWLFELGNGDKFLFDLGTGSMANVMSLMIPANYLTKVFLSHLHTDHVGDLASLWAQTTVMAAVDEPVEVPDSVNDPHFQVH